MGVTGAVTHVREVAWPELAAGIEGCVLCVGVSHSVVPNSLQAHGLQPTRLLCPWDFPGENIGVGCHFLLQKITLFY